MRIVSGGARRAVPVAVVAAAAALAWAAPGYAANPTASAVGTDKVTMSQSYPGRAISYAGGDHANQVTVHIGETSIVFTDPAAVGLSTTAPCVLTNSTTVTCPKAVGPEDTDKVFNVSVIGNGGNDQLSSSGFGMVSGSTFRPVAVTLSGFAGNDTIVAGGGMSQLVGGLGDDYLQSGPGTSTSSQFRDMLYGSEGNDTINTTINSPDVDGIYCDTQQNQSFTDWLTRNAADVQYGYFVYPFSSIGGGCDNVTIG